MLPKLRDQLANVALSLTGASTASACTWPQELQDFDLAQALSVILQANVRLPSSCISALFMLYRSAACMIYKIDQTLYGVRNQKLQVT